MFGSIVLVILVGISVGSYLYTGSLQNLLVFGSIAVMWAITGIINKIMRKGHDYHQKTKVWGTGTAGKKFRGNPEFRFTTK